MLGLTEVGLGLTPEVIIFALTFLVIFVSLRWMGGGGKNRRRRRYPPCLPYLPLAGSLPFLGSPEKMPEYFMTMAEKLGPIIGFYSGRRFVVVLNGKETIVEALVKNAADFSDRPSIYTEKYVANVNFKGLLFKSYNESFKRYHKLSMSILKKLGFGEKDVSERMIQSDVEELIDEIRRKDGKPFDVKEMLTTAVFSATPAILFGKKFKLMNGGAEHRDLLENLDKHANSIDTAAFDIAPMILRLIPFYEKKLTASAEAHVELRRCIAAGVKSSLEEEEEDNFVKRFTETEGPGYDREELFFVLRDLLGGATETLSTTIRWATVLLANSPAVQARLHEEIDSAIARDRLPSLDDRARLPYTEAVILEVMRVKTISPLSIPHAVARDTELGGFFIPKDSMVLVNLLSVHMDRKVWSDPDVFRPERFLDEDNRVTHREKMIPFSLGKRACPGENLARKSLFLFLTALLHRFLIRPPEGQDSIVVSDVYNIVSSPSAFDVRFIQRWEL